MNHDLQNPSEDRIANIHRTALQARNCMTTTDVPPPPVSQPRTSVATPVAKEYGCEYTLPGSNRIRHSPAHCPTPSASKTSDHTPTAMARLQASQANAPQLQSENQQTKIEIHKIIREIVDSSALDKSPLDPEWCWILSSSAEINFLQANYDELWNKHVKSSCEITSDLYAKMVQRHDDLRRLYEWTQNSCAELQDLLHTLTRQLTDPSGHEIIPLLTSLEDKLPVVGPRTILDVLRGGDRAPSRASQPVLGKRPMQAASMHWNDSTDRLNERYFEQRIPPAGNVISTNVHPGVSASSSHPPKRRKVSHPAKTDQRPQ